MSKTLRSILSVFIAVALVLTAIPFTAIAEAIDISDVKAEVETVDNSADSNVKEQSKTAPSILGELVDKRESNVKHFKMSDGTITAAVYPYDVHFENADGKFLDIDNSLSSENDGTDDVFSNKNNETFVKFMKKSNPNKLYTINKGDHKIKVSIDGVSKVEAVLQENNKNTVTDEKYTLKNIGSKISYADILNNTDIEYTLISTEIKENIILKEKVDFNSLIYTYHLSESINAVQKDSKNITLYDKDGNFVFNISAPVMWDSNDNYSEALSLEILENKNSKIKVKLSWEIPEDFKYPITIDPVAEPVIDRNQIQDTHIIASNPTQNYDVNNHIRVRNDGYAMLRFPTPNLEKGDKIVHAQLALAPYGAYDTSNANYSNVNSFNPPLYITTHKILRTWEETTATYNNINPENGFYDGITQSYAVVDNNSHYYYWDITRLLNEWVEGYSTNYGVLFKYAAPPSDGSVFDSFFCSTNGLYLPVEARPQLIYQYINETGVENYFSYHTQDLGYAGTAYTNDITGNLTIVNPVVHSGGSVNAIDVALVYNADTVYKTDAPYGRGWKLNYSQTIELDIDAQTVIGTDPEYAYYIDGDGTKHYFKKDSETRTWVDEINPERKIICDSIKQNLIIKDNNGNSLYFYRSDVTGLWHLYASDDSYYNGIHITLDSANPYKITKITSSPTRTVDFSYSQYGFLDRITYYDGDTAKSVYIGYNNYVTTHNNGISDITFADGKVVQYHYHNDNTTTENKENYFISKIYDIDGTHTAYDYHWNFKNKVASVTSYDNSSTPVQGDRMSISYSTTSSTFTDEVNNRKYLYTFSKQGTLESTVDVTDNDGNGYGQYYKYGQYDSNQNFQISNLDNVSFLSKSQKSTVNLLKNHSFEYDGEHSFTAWNETTSTASGGYTTEKSHIGARSYKITRPASSDCSRAIGFYYMYIEGGKTYTLSAYVNTSAMTSAGKGASLMFIDTEKVYESEYITEAIDKWQRLSLTFTAKRSEYVSICMNLCGATGSVYFDNIQLEVGDLSDYNLLENAGFEDDNSSSPRGWSPSTNKGSISETTKISGNRAISIQGSASIHKHYLQTLAVPNGKNGDTYVASAFAKANSVPAIGWRFTVLIRFLKNGSMVNEENILFNSYTTEWQKIAGVAKATGDYDTVTFWLLYYNNCNTVYFDNAQLIKDTFGNTYKYDEEGNLVSSIDLQDKEEYTFKYNISNKLIKENSITGSKILYSYTSPYNNELRTVTAGGVSSLYTYDDNGNPTSSVTMGSDLVDGKVYYLQNVYYSKFLGVTEEYLDIYGHAAMGLKVTLDDYTDSYPYQRWILRKNNETSYFLSPENYPSMYLGVCYTADGVGLATYAFGEVQYHTLQLNKTYGNIYCMEFYRNTGYNIDTDGSNVYAYSKHGGEIQQFAFIPVEENMSVTTPAITSTATYTESGEYTSSVTDSRGNTTHYEYNEDRGYLKSETNAKGVKTSYTYNSGELLEKVNVGSSNVTYGYDNAKRLSSITSPSGTVYGFTYDSFGRSDTVKVGSRTLSDYLYDSKGRADTFTYGNGTTVKYGYDHLNRQTSTTINNVLRYNKLYDGHSRLLQIEDILLGKKVRYEYDILDRAVGERLINTATNKVYADLKIRYDDTKNRVAGYDVNIEGISKATDFVYGGNGLDPDIISSVKHNNTTKLSYAYDSLNRLKTRTISTSTPFVTEYGFLNGNGTMRTTTLVKTVKNGNDTLLYSYDKLGNITSITKNNNLVESYTYDNLNQLKTVTVEKGEVDDVYTYTYDNGGNILSVTLNGEVIKSYTYGDSEWKDLLTNYNGERDSEGQIKVYQYDAIGNPLSYRNGMSFTWADGRKLATVTKGTDSISYTYNSDGLRTSKTVNGTATEYYWLNGMLQGQKTGSEYIIFLHDENGTAYGFLLKNGTTEEYYYYIFNAQGDVIGILDSTGTKVVEYTYNVWGELLGITGTLKDTIGQKNPLRYRGYYFDSETGFYLTGTRYYDSEIGRFINADGYVSTGQGILGTNMFAYCGNNPVNRVDPTGQFWSEIWEFAKTAVAEIGKAMGVMSPAYAGCGGAALGDGPLPFGDIIGFAGAALLTVGTIGYGIYQATQAPAISVPKVEEKSKDIVIPKEPDNPVIFPVDPNTFNPVGLVKVPRAGTKNGAFISWMDPLTNTEVFRWDENPNYSNGPHYHIHGTGHYYPGMIVPEPYATMYFPVG